MKKILMAFLMCVCGIGTCYAPYMTDAELSSLSFNNRSGRGNNDKFLFFRDTADNGSWTHAAECDGNHQTKIMIIAGMTSMKLDGNFVYFDNSATLPPGKYVEAECLDGSWTSNSWKISDAKTILKCNSNNAPSESELSWCTLQNCKNYYENYMTTWCTAIPCYNCEEPKPDTYCYISLDSNDQHIRWPNDTGYYTCTHNTLKLANANHTSIVFSTTPSNYISTGKQNCKLKYNSATGIDFPGSENTLFELKNIGLDPAHCSSWCTGSVANQANDVKLTLTCEEEDRPAESCTATCALPESEKTAYNKLKTDIEARIKELEAKCK